MVSFLIKKKKGKSFMCIRHQQQQMRKEKKTNPK
jgi:hypothetical protein